jgi:hypothetical protein
MEQLLTQTFPDYKITDASNRNGIEFKKINNISINIDKLIVFIFKNKGNELLFNTHKTETNLLILNTGRLLLFNYYTPILFKNKHLMSLKRFIQKENTCPICLEVVPMQHSTDLTVSACSQCGNIYHRKCQYLAYCARPIEDTSLFKCSVCNCEEGIKVN